VKLSSAEGYLKISQHHCCRRYDRVKHLFFIYIKTLILIFINAAAVIKPGPASTNAGAKDFHADEQLTGDDSASS
jgi:hypothetical protein